MKLFRIPKLASNLPFLSAVPVGLLLAFYISVHLKTVAALLLVAVAASIWLASRHTASTDETRITCYLERVLTALIFLFPLLVVGVQSARMYTGTQGVDFGIYAQVVHRFAELNRLDTSLLGLGWTHFLTHHLSPYLFIVGFTARILGNAVAALLIWHAIGISATLCGIYRILRFYAWNKAEVLFALSAVVLLPAPRVALLWEVHDEIFAIPLLIWGLYFFLKRSSSHMYGMLLAACAIKETMWLVLSVFAAMDVAQEVFTAKHFRLEKQVVCKAGVAFLLGILGFLLYTRVLPGWLFWSSFDGFTRIGTLNQLIAPQVVRAKIWWLTTLMIPASPLIVALLTCDDRRKRVFQFLLYALPAAPFMAAILASNFEQMYQPFKYYSVIPSIFIFLAALAAFSDATPQKAVLVAACLLAASVGPRSENFLEIRSAMAVGDISSPVKKVVPANSVVLVPDYDVPLFFTYRQVIRLFCANRNNPRFDYVIKRKSDPTKLSLYLRSWTAPYYEDQTWMVRRAMPRVRMNLEEDVPQPLPKNSVGEGR